MRRAYKAVLHGDRVEWLDGALETDGPVQIYVTIAATAIAHNLTLVTHNTDDLRWIYRLELLDPLPNLE